MIAKQEYPGEKDYIAHFNYCLSAFRDHRQPRGDCRRRGGDPRLRAQRRICRGARETGKTDMRFL